MKRLLDYWPSTKRQNTKLHSPPVAKETDHCMPAPMDSPNDHDLLTQFDLDARYGPALHLTRLERWERARRFGLEPPVEVKRLLDGGAEQRCIFEGRVV